MVHYSAHSDITGYFVVEYFGEFLDPLMNVKTLQKRRDFSAKDDLKATLYIRSIQIKEDNLSTKDKG